MIVKHNDILYELKEGRYSNTATIIKCLSNSPKITIPKEIEYTLPNSKDQKEQESPDGQECHEDKGSVKYIINAISSCAFKNCENLKFINFDSSQNIEYLGKNAFSNCISLNKIKIPSSIIHISNGCFLNCIHLKSVETDADIESIGRSAFEGCRSLKSINGIINDKLQYIYEDAFKDCCNLSIDAKIDSLKEIRKNAFDNCKQVSIIGDSLKYGNGAIYESINSNINTKWDISHKVLIPFGIIVVLWLIYGISGALIPRFESLS